MLLSIKYAYAFDRTNYLNLSQASKIIINKEMDDILSYWMKTNQTNVATLLSNSKGDATDLLVSNGLD